MAPSPILLTLAICDVLVLSVVVAPPPTLLTHIGSDSGLQPGPAPGLHTLRVELGTLLVVALDFVLGHMTALNVQVEPRVPLGDDCSRSPAHPGPW